LLPIATMEAGSQELGVKVLSLCSIGLLFHWQNFLPRLNYSTADYLCSATQYIQHTFMIIYDHHWSDILGHTRSINSGNGNRSVLYTVLCLLGATMLLRGDCCQHALLLWIKPDHRPQQDHKSRLSMRFNE
jgi:hypothetical protein